MISTITLLAHSLLENCASDDDLDNDRSTINGARQLGESRTRVYGLVASVVSPAVGGRRTTWNRGNTYKLLLLSVKLGDSV